jgi:hypothetical protein
VVGQAPFSRPGDAPTADEAGVGDGVVGGAERAAGEECLAGGEEAGDGVEPSGLQGFLKGEGEGWRGVAGRASSCPSRRADEIILWVS